jgi:preprotein translocase subunit SecE
MSKKENPGKAPDQKPIFQKAAAMAKQKEAEKKNNKGKTKEKVSIWKRITRFFKDMKSEAKKIVWPSKKQVVNNTIVVLVVIILCSVVIWPLDWLFLRLFSLMF